MDTLPVEILFQIFMCLYQSGDPVYAFARKVCRLWYGVYCELTSQGYICKLQDVCDHILDYPEEFADFVVPSARRSDRSKHMFWMLQTGMRKGLVSQCERFAEKNRISTDILVEFALEYNFPNFVFSKILDGSSDPKSWCSGSYAYVFHYEMQCLYDYVPEEYRFYAIAYPSDTAMQYYIREYGANIQSEWIFFGNFSRDSPSHAERVLRLLKIFKVPDKTVKRLIDLYSTRYTYQYHHTLQLLSTVYQ